MIAYKNECPCGDFEFSLKYESPTSEAVDLFCPFCGVPLDLDKEETEDEDYDLDEE